MKNRRASVAAVAAVILALGASGLHAGVAAGAPYQIDPAETRATFLTRFLGFVPVRGEFKRTTGVLDYDPVTRQGSIRAAIHANTLQTPLSNGQGTGQMLRGREFFDVDKFPTIDFVSSKFQWDDERLVAIEGMLTLRGVTRPATLSIEKSHCAAAAAEKKARCEAVAQFVIKRSEFGMTGWATTVSDEVKISVEFVAQLEPSEPASPVTIPTPVTTLPVSPQTK